MTATVVNLIVILSVILVHVLSGKLNVKIVIHITVTQITIAKLQTNAVAQKESVRRQAVQRMKVYLYG
jgi:hypothetical protein